MPGPLEVVTAIAPPKAAPMAERDRGDFVLGLERAHAEVLVAATARAECRWPA